MLRRRRFARVPTRSSTARRRRERSAPPGPPAPVLQTPPSETLLLDRAEDLWGGSSLELELPQALLEDRSI